jgi:hypothetical protein
LAFLDEADEVGDHDAGVDPDSVAGAFSLVLRPGNCPSLFQDSDLLMASRAESILLPYQLGRRLTA